MSNVIGQENTGNDEVNMLGIIKKTNVDPVKLKDRIAALDVIRGFALIGIFMMNIEFFNRSVLEIGQGIPKDVTGIDWLASYFVQYFIAGKFWTIFSLLFGMGFSLMLNRAQEKQQEFIQPYIRRVAALAVFGALHFIFLWPGDILFSYAATAVMLMVILFAKPKWIAISIVALAGLGLIPHLSIFAAFSAILSISGLLILFIRYEKIVDCKVVKLPFLSSTYLAIGLMVLIYALITFFVPALKKSALPSFVFGFVFLFFGYLMARFHQPKEHRTLSAGIGFYMSIFIIVTIFGAIEYYSPKKLEDKVVSQTTLAQSKTENKQSTDNLLTKKQQDELKKDKEKKAEKALAKLEAAEEKRIDIATLTKGSYADVVTMRATSVKEDAINNILMSVTALPLFLIGFWFVNQGLMQNTTQHLSTFKKLAVWCLPIGIGIGIASSFIMTGADSNTVNDGYMFAMGLQMMGNLPACIGYVALIVYLLHGRLAQYLQILAPYGRMALTNYLTQSLIASYFFYGYGFGLWGMGRAQQLGFAVMVIALQIVFSHWWLKRFRYGPLEAIWRAITYWKFSNIRITTH